MAGRIAWRRVGAWGAAIAAACVLLPVVAWAVSRYWPLSSERRAALAVLDRPQPVPGRNAFDALYLLERDVPADRRAALVAADVARARQALAAAPHGELPHFEPLQDAPPAIPLPARSDNVKSCASRTPNCLVTARADGVAYAQWLDALAVVEHNAAAIHGYGHYRSPFPPELAPETMPALKSSFLPLDRAALDFVGGRQPEALSAVCSHIEGWRPLIANSDNLLLAMVAAEQVRSGARLLADMAAELPRGESLPPACATALRPLSVDEQRLCEPMRGEARLGRQILEQTEASRNPLLHLLFDAERTRAYAAPKMAWPCGEAAGRAIAEDRVGIAPATPTSLHRFECLGNYMGCILAAIAAPAYADYQVRVQDAAAQLRLTGAAAWLREHAVSAAEVPSALTRLPAQWRSPARVPALIDDGRSLQVPMLSTSRPDMPPLRAALPAWQQAAAVR